VNFWNRRILLLALRSGEGLFSERTAGAQAWRPELVFLPLCRPSHPRLDELGDFGDLVTDFAALAAAGLF
jgi:hypothetical protein